MLPFTEFKELASEAKKITLNEIHSMGISDTIRVFCSKTRPRFVGQYRGYSQFSKSGILFKLFPTITDIVLETITEDEKVFGYSHVDLPTEVLRGMIDTLLHEYGHVIAELMKCQRPRMYKFILSTWNDEEDYAEDFMRMIRYSDSAFENQHNRIIKAFKKELN